MEESKELLKHHIKFIDGMISILKRDLEVEQVARKKAEDEVMTLLCDSFQITELKDKNSNLQQEINKQNAELISLTVTLAQYVGDIRELERQNKKMRNVIKYGRKPK